MKLLILVTFSFISLNSFASSIDLSGLHPLEIEAVNTATSEERALLMECLLDEKTMKVDDTSCVNEVFGDVHN